ncbi:MAG TPA: DUF2298 domain-containing protein [Candidatus Portnoybacteria bacterium]|nr:DUF2298 domain-containing protein [Candidatus Portnoybacteria bacterium]
MKLIIFWAILFFFGYQLAERILKQLSKETLIALSGLIGIGFYIFLINVLGYIIPINVAFYLVLLIFLLYGMCCFLRHRSNKREWGINKKWRKIILILAILSIVVTFIVDNRYPLGGDQVLLTCIPTAATIAEGNFPPQAIWMPQYPLRYHYGAHLFTAAIYKVTGLPLYMSYDIQIAVLVCVLFLLGFILAKKIVNNNKKALISSILMLGVGNLVFLKGINGIVVLYNKYILGHEIFAPFKFVFEMIESLFSRPVEMWMVNFPTNALSFVLLIGIIYLYFDSIQNNNKKVLLITIPLLSVLALFSEIFFIVVCFLLIIYPIVFGIISKNWPCAKKFLVVALLILLISVPIALVQGGVLTHYLGRDGHNLKLHQTYGYTNIELINKGFEINVRPWILMTRIGQDNRLPIYSLEFLLQWGLLLILIFCSVVYFWKKKNNFVIFLELAFGAFFVAPFFIVFPLELCSTERFFYAANLFGGLLIGLWLSNIYVDGQNKILKRFIWLLIGVLMLQTIIFQLIFLTVGYPVGKWNNIDKFFAKSNSFDVKIYQWVKENTTISDYFLIVQPDDYEMAPNLKFTINTGRMAPIYTYHANNDPIDIPQSYAFVELKKGCNTDLIKLLDYHYVLVNKNWPDGLEEKCLENNKLELKFEETEGDNFIRIYKVL